VPRSLVTGCGYAKGRRLHDTAPPLRATLPCGRAEPAPTRRCAPRKEASRGRSPRPRREDLSEGCAPRVRGVRPYASPGMACSSKGERTPSGPMETCPVKPIPSLWACRARPSRGASPRRMALRGKPGHNAGGGFLGGALCASGCRGRNQAQAQHDNRGQTNAWWPREHTPRSSASLPRGRAEPAPPRRRLADGRRAWEVGPKISRRVLYSEGRTLCARMATLNEG
jgi:hypothetical protein